MSMVLRVGCMGRLLGVEEVKGRGKGRVKQYGCAPTVDIQMGSGGGFVRNVMLSIP